MPVTTGRALALTSQNATLTCSASSQPPSTFTWWFNGSQVATGSVYESGSLTLHHNGAYTCMAFNSITNKNSTASHMLTVIGEWDETTTSHFKNSLRLAYVHIRFSFDPNPFSPCRTGYHGRGESIGSSANSEPHVQPDLWDDRKCFLCALDEGPTASLPRQQDGLLHGQHHSHIQTSLSLWQWTLSVCRGQPSEPNEQQQLHTHGQLWVVNERTEFVLMLTVNDVEYI